jgi:hypothetical protein
MGDANMQMIIDGDGASHHSSSVTFRFSAKVLPMGEAGHE